MRVPLAAALGALLALAGCEDVRRFAGNWAGPVSADPALRQGFGPDAVLRLSIAQVTRTALEASVDVPGAGLLRFEPLRPAAHDALGDLRLDGEPLRTFLGFARPPGAEPYLVVISLFPEDRIAARVIRGPDEVYGVFSLERAAGPR